MTNVPEVPTTERRVNGVWSPQAIGFYIFSFALLFGAPLIVNEMSWADWLVWFFSAGSLLVLIAPAAFIRNYDLFQPLTFVTMDVAIGVTGRVLWLMSTSDTASASKMLRGQPPSYLLTGVCVIFLGMCTFTFGYFLKPGGPRLRPVERVFQWYDRPWSVLRMTLLSIALVFLAALGFYLFVKALGLKFDLSLLDNFSAKRFVAFTNGVSSSLGPQRQLMRGTAVAFLVVFTWFAFSRKGWFSFGGILSMFLLFLAEIPPIFTSSRSDVVMFPLVAIAIWNYSRGRLRMRQLAIFALAGMMVVAILGSLRSGKNDDLGAAAISSMSGGVIDSIVNNSNFMSAPTTTHMIAAIPDPVPFEYGSTLVVWLVAPIPRTLWPGKPEVVTGQLVARTVFNRQTGLGKGGGVPPNIISDLYWNFGMIGVALGMFAFGCILRMLYYSALPYITKSPSGLLLYFLTIFPYTHYTLAGSVAQGMVRTMSSTVLVGVVIALVSVKRKRSAATAESLATSPAT